MLILLEIRTHIHSSVWSLISSDTDAHLASVNVYCAVKRWQSLMDSVLFVSKILNSYAIRGEFRHNTCIVYPRRLYGNKVRRISKPCRALNIFLLIERRILQLFYVDGHCSPWTDSLEPLRHRKDRKDTISVKCSSDFTVLPPSKLLCGVLLLYMIFVYAINPRP